MRRTYTLLFGQPLDELIDGNRALRLALKSRRRVRVPRAEVSERQQSGFERHQGFVVDRRDGGRLQQRGNAVPAGKLYNSIKTLEE